MRFRAQQLESRRYGISRVELIAVVAVLFLLGGIVIPLISSSRETARQTQCQANLQAFGRAFHAYHDAHRRLPPAAVWKTTGIRSMALHLSTRFDRFTYGNWVQFLLPYLQADDVQQSFDVNLPVAAIENLAGRMKRLDVATCPSDDFNHSKNPYQFEVPDGNATIDFARGNVGINGGTHNHRFGPDSSSAPLGDGLELVMNDATREYRLVGNGIAGINQSFALDDFTNGLSTLVAVDELRAGIHPRDPRGVWSLGQIGGSISWAHGISGDDCGPNNLWERADDVLGCGTLHEILGPETLMQERMPCVDYVERNQQATARSMHEGGVNVLFVDGSVRFISDNVDRGVWHVMHSRETPSSILADDFESRLTQSEPFPESSRSLPTESNVMVDGPDVENSRTQPLIINSIGMTFTHIPGGEFTMGVPDRGNDQFPEEAPPHEVALLSYWIGAHEVTQSQFEQVTGDNPSRKLISDLISKGTDLGDFPVESVTWDEAQQFCRKLSELPEETAAGRTYRLPTEAEWEFACRSRTSKPYDWNPQRRNTDNSGEAAGIEPPLPLAEVGSYPPNPLGLYDMRGNVWEWTADWFDRSYYSRSPKLNPRGPANGYLKVVRGSDWTFIGEPCLINYPMMPPWKRSRFVGFRVVCEVADANVMDE